MATTDTYTTDDTWEVPQGVTSIDVVLYGAAGQDVSNNNAAGDGGKVEATDVPVQEGETINIIVGQQGGGGAGGPAGGGGTGNPEAGANGGGHSRIYGSQSGDLAAAGGGGGTGGDFSDSNSYSGGAGGAAADPDGNSGGGGGSSEEPGGGASQSSGGAGGGTADDATDGTDGSQYAGGAGGDGSDGNADFDIQDGSGGGGGGSGYYGGGGGGGGAAGNAGAGGGGGSSWVASSAGSTTYTLGARSGDGEVQITYTVPPPGEPTATDTVTGDESADVTIDAPTSGGTVGHYDVHRQVDGGGFTQIAEEQSAGTYAYGIPAGADTVQYRVRATNNQGSSSWNYTAQKSTDITSVTTSNTGETSFDLSWDAVDDAQEYDVLLAEASGSTEADYTIDQTVTTTSATVTGLEHGEKFYVRVIARYPEADSLSTVEANTTTGLPSPTLDSLDAATKREITVHYTLDDNSSDGDVLVELSPDGGQSWPHSTVVSDLSATKATIGGLLDGVTYTVRVTRRTDHATSQSGTTVATTVLPGVRYLLVGVSPTATTIDLPAWTPVANNGSQRVEYRRSDVGGSPGAWQTAATDLDQSTTNYTITGLLAGEEYDARVVTYSADASTPDIDPGRILAGDSVTVPAGAVLQYDKPLTIEGELTTVGTATPEDTN